MLELKKSAAESLAAIESPSLDPEVEKDEEEEQSLE